MKNALVVVVIFIVLGGGVWLLMRSVSGPEPSEAMKKTGDMMMEEENMEVMDETKEEVEEAMSEGVLVEIENFAFSPKTITVAAGEKITVTNNDVAGHTFTSDDGVSFDTGIIGKGQSKVVVAPSEPGEYPFHCTPHPNTTGKLIVQ